METEQKVTAFFTILFVITSVVVGMLYGVFAWAFVAKLFYEWFIITKFSFMPILGIKAFAGIMFFLQAFFPKYYPTGIKKEYKDESNNWYYLLLTPWASLIFGWVFKIFIL